LSEKGGGEEQLGLALSFRQERDWEKKMEKETRKRKGWEQKGVSSIPGNGPEKGPIFSKGKKTITWGRGAPGGKKRTESRCKGIEKEKKPPSPHPEREVKKRKYLASGGWLGLRGMRRNKKEGDASPSKKGSVDGTREEERERKVSKSPEEEGTAGLGKIATSL